MNGDSLGPLISEYRTSRIQAIVLFVMAAVLLGLSAWMFIWDKNIGTPIALVCVPGALYLFGWGYKLAVPVLEIRQQGVRLKLPICRVEIPFNRIASLGPCMRTTLHGQAGSASGIWFQRVDGSRVTFPLESNVEEACRQILELAAAAR